MMPGKAFLLPSINLLALLLLAAACTQAPKQEEAAATEEEEPVLIRLWAQVGPDDERAALRDQISDFNTIRTDYQIELHFLPADEYHTSVLAATESGEPPDILAIDAPHFHAFASRGHLHPLDDLLPEEIRDDLLPSAIDQGSYEGTLYSVPLYDSGLGLFIDTREFIGAARIPRGIHNSWTIDEFDEILALLHEKNGGEPVLDLKLNYGRDWIGFAFTPVLLSAGADLVDRENYRRADGIVNSPEAVEAMSRVQSWFQKGYIDPNEDDAAFVEGRTAISWTGHWDGLRYLEALDGHVRLVPLPDFGEGSRTNQGAWSWAIPAQSENPEGAMEFLATLLETDTVLRFSEVTGGVPARYEAIERSSHFSEGADLNLFVKQLEQIATPRPRTIAYPSISAAFTDAFEEIREGADVQETLDQLALQIESHLEEDASLETE